MNDYRLINRKNRKIQVIFRILPGKCISTGADNERDAIIFAERYLLNYDGVRIEKVPTFKEFANGFYANDKYEYIKRIGKKKRYIKDVNWINHEARIQNYWIPQFGRFLLSAVSSVAIDSWFMNLKHYKKLTPLADSTKNKILNAGRAIFKEAVWRKIIKENPINGIEKIIEENKHREPLTDFELAKLFPKSEKELLKIWLDRKWLCYFLIMRDTGWRPGEVAGLARKNYYTNFGGVYTEQSIDRRTGEVQNRIKTTKKGIQYKIGYFSDVTISQLNKYLKEENLILNDLIFKTKKGKGIKPDASNNHFKASCERAGIEIGNRTQYSFRHTFDTKMLQHLSLDEVNLLMGHIGYRGEYDHRTPTDILGQYATLKSTVQKNYKIG